MNGIAGPVPSDEELMALADGEIEGAQADALYALIAEDPDLAERFAVLAETRALLGPDIEAPTAGTDPAHDRLAGAILAMAAAQAAPTPVEPPQAPVAAPRPTLSVIPGGRRDDPGPGSPVLRPNPVTTAQPVQRRWDWAIAAAVTLVLGAVGGYLAAPAGAPPAVALHEHPAIAPVLATALAGTASGTAVTLAGGAGVLGRLTPVSTHTVAGDGVCREWRLDVDAPVRSTTIGVGCRQGNTWQTVFALTQPVVPTGGFAPASTPAEIADQILAGMGSAGPVSQAEEQRLLKARP